MTRKQAINALRFAGYHADQAEFTRIYIECRISLTVANEAFEAGRMLKAKGMSCGCRECAQVALPTRRAPFALRWPWVSSAVRA